MKRKHKKNSKKQNKKQRGKRKSRKQALDLKFIFKWVLVTLIAVFLVMYAAYKALRLNTIKLTSIFMAGVSYVYNAFEEDQIASVENVPAIEKRADSSPEVKLEFDLDTWKFYQNAWYGFEIKYPADWAIPSSRRPVGGGSKYEYKYSFYNTADCNTANDSKEAQGFEVIIYNTQKTPDLINTDEIALIDSDLAQNGGCQELTQIKTSTENELLKEILIPKDDPCFKEIFFYSVTKDNYIYNIVPKINENQNENQSKEDHDPIFQLTQQQQEDLNKKQIAEKEVPEIVSAVSSFKLTGKKPKTGIKKYVVPLMRCPHPERKPRESKTKSRHMDEDCCMDPDEWPNPKCKY